MTGDWVLNEQQKKGLQLTGRVIMHSDCTHASIASRNDTMKAADKCAYSVSSTASQCAQGKQRQGKRTVCTRKAEAGKSIVHLLAARLH